MAGFAKRLVFSAVFGPPRKRTEAAVPAQYLELIPTSRSYSLPAFYLKTPHPYGLCKYTIVYCHGTGEDLARGFWWLDYLVHTTGINALAFEFSGFFEGSGRPSERKCNQDFHDAVQHLVTTGRSDIEHIVVYGRSLGSGPAIDFASRNPVAAMVLECPFLSISRVVTRGLERYKTLPQSWDIFPSYKRMSSVKCPVFIAHGNRDAVVPYSHAQGLLRVCERSGTPVQLAQFDGSGHNNIRNNFEGYMETLFQFLALHLDLMLPPSPLEEYARVARHKRKTQCLGASGEAALDDAERQQRMAIAAGSYTSLPSTVADFWASSDEADATTATTSDSISEPSISSTSTTSASSTTSTSSVSAATNAAGAAAISTNRCRDLLDENDEEEDDESTSRTTELP